MAAGFVAILLLATGIRGFGTDFGLPFLYDVDEPVFVDMAFRIFESGDLNPHWFGHPGSLTIYSLTLVYWLYDTIGLAAGSLAATANAVAQFHYEPSQFYLIGRGQMVVFGVLMVVMTYLIARRVAGRWTSLLAMAIVAVAPLTVEYSRLIRTDGQLAVLMLATLWFAMAAAEEGRWRDYLLAGLTLGLGVATKYPAVVMASIIGLAWLLKSGRSRAMLFDRFPRLVGAGAMSLFGAFLGAPFLFLDFRTALADISVEVRPYHLSATSQGPLDALGFYLQNALVESLTLTGVLLALLGGGMLLLSGRRQAVLLPAYAVVFMGFLCVQHLRWERWAVPLLPVVAILGAVGAAALVSWIRRTVPALGSWGGMAVAGMVAGLLLVPPLYASFGAARALAQDHTITMASRWVMANIEPGAVILAERYTPQLPRGDYAVLHVDKGRITPVEEGASAYVRVFDPIADLTSLSDLHDSGAQYAMVGNDYDRRLAEGERERAKVAIYEHLFACSTLLYEVAPVPRKVAGSPVRIYHLGPYCGVLWDDSEG